MPKAVKLGKGKEITFDSIGNGATFERVYDWKSWLNPDPKQFPGGYVLLEQSLGEKDDKGNVVKVTEKRDFNVSMFTMIGAIIGAARRNFKHVDISRRDADGEKLVNAVIIRARDMTEDEKFLEMSRRSNVKLRKLKKQQEAAEVARTQQQGPPSEVA